MIGALLAVSATFFDEISSLIGKQEITRRKETIYTAGFLYLFWGTIIFAAIVLYKGVFLFSYASLPTFTIRVILEIVILELSLTGLARADRSTFSFIHTGTIPLILVVDIFLGYTIDLYQFLGILLFGGVVVFLVTHHGIRKKGALFVSLSTILAVVTISLFKYNITHFNAPEAEQLVAHSILLAYMFLVGTFIRKQNPFRLFMKPIPFVQSLTAGIGSVLMTFAYVFAPASVIVALKRIGEILWATISGSLYFHERHILLKVGVMGGLVVAILLLVM